MTHSYRLYTLGRDGSIKGATDHEFRSDEDALRYARTMLTEAPGIELWQTTRLVGRVDRTGGC